MQVRVDNGEFADATFGNGVWQTAIFVPDPEGRTLNVTVRAIDNAGRITQVNQAIGTNLSVAPELDTTITSGPANPSNVNSASFAFSGSATAAVFECQLDDGLYQPCASPTTYSDLSKGSHTFRVHAVDSNGAVDPTPASFTWSVNAVQPEVTINSAPSNPTTSRTASFSFSASGAASFECALDGSLYGACTSPKSYTNLTDGLHSFTVRAKTSGGSYGTATQFKWAVVNAAPVASNQTVIVIPNIAKSVVLTATDSDPLVYSIVTPPTRGTLLGVPPNLSYVPDTGFGGVDSFTFKASDGLTESNVATVTIFVDNVPPVVTCSITPNNLWPPNHKLVNIQATVNVSDLHSGPAGFTLVSVTSSEADAGLDSTDVPNDIQNWVAGTPDVVGRVRAERSETGNGRLYTLTYEGKDVANNRARCTTMVSVPKNQGSLAAATYDENQVFEDAFTETLPYPTVTLPVEETTNNDDENGDLTGQTIRAFLPLVNW